MDIINIKPEYEETYFNCLENWSDEMREAGDHKARWYEKMKGNGIRVKLAKAENGDICGMIQYLPSQYSFIEGESVYFIKCIWVHGYEDGIGNYQKKGIGTRLIEEAEKDCKEMGAKALVAWGISLPFFMRASWFKKHGYKKIDRYNGMVLLWKPFVKDIEPPKFVRIKKKPGKISGKVSIKTFVNGWCPAQNIVFERAKKAAEEFGDAVIVEVLDTTDKKVFEEWGIMGAVYLDGKLLQKGAPPSYEKIHHLISKRVEKLKV